MAATAEAPLDELLLLLLEPPGTEFDVAAGPAAAATADGEFFVPVCCACYTTPIYYSIASFSVLSLWNPKNRVNEISQENGPQISFPRGPALWGRPQTTRSTKTFFF